MLIWAIFVVGLQLGEGNLAVTNTSSGEIVGLKMIMPGFIQPVITRYTGIPYAEPPTGQLRFAKPVPRAPWSDVLNATDFGPSCPQIPVGAASLFDQLFPNMNFSEDCLVLNVYVPHDAVASSGPLPVMIYIHGGGLTNGRGDLYDGTLLAVQGQVIVVNFNYRLGLFGFLSTGDDAAPGNYGLWDQRLAIQWVKDNIADFGGDPNQITIFGQSAGGWSVTYQMISPLNDNNLFQRVIAQSGAAFHGQIISGISAQREALNLASALGCDSPYESSSRTVISCLRESSMQDLLRHGDLFKTAPTIDGEFLTTDINSLLSHPRVGQYDLLLGVNSREGTFIHASVPDNLSAGDLRDSIRASISNVCRCKNPQAISDAITTFYFGGDKLADPRGNVLKYLDVVGDVSFFIPSVYLLGRHTKAAEGTNTYFYYFVYETGKDVFLPPQWDDWVSGSPQGLELLYVFGLTNSLYPGDAEAAALSNQIMNFWAQFARSGNPNAVGSPEWPDFDPENETYIILNVNISTGQRLKADKVAFWNEYIPTITEPFNEKTCSYDVPVRSGTVQKPDTKTVQIESKDGEVLGSIIGALRVADEAMGGREVAEFLGIPYAKPPLGDLRFKPPEDTGPWGDQPLGIPEKLPAACPQDVTQDPWMVRLGLNHTSEDCLTLNIYAPTQNANDTALPVLVFVHTGFGVHGTSSVHDATLLASQIRTIVVVLNYRLGALGFVSTGDEAAPGYYGLHDILTSLKWVNKYIGSFGGDPGRVTVFGHGSGGVLTHLLVLSEKAKGLFNRTVLMATTAISPPVNNQVIPSAPETTKALATKLGCPTTSSEAMINCLREKPAADIVSNTVNPPFGVAFPVVVDGDFITDRPIELLKNGRINDVDVIVGVPLDENGARSLLFTGLGCPSVGELEQYIETVSRLSFLNPGEAASALATEYIGKGGLGDDCETRGSFRKLLNDQLSGWSLLETARLHADAGQSAYVYLFEHKPSVQYRPLLPLYGATADDSLQFLFGDPYSPLVDKFDLSYRLNDKRVTLEHMEFLKNFIYNGNPGTSLSGVEWPSFDSDDLKYMSLTDCPQAYSGVDNDWPHLLRFWAAYLPTITSPVPPPSEVTPCPPDQEPCVVGEGIGLKLSSEQATAVIETLIGAVIGALVLSVFFFGGCMAYRARVDRIERHNLRATREGLPYKLDVGEREESSSPL